MRTCVAIPFSVRVIARPSALRVSPVPGAAHNGLLDQAVFRNIVLEMYELDMRVNERVPQYLLRMVNVFFLSKKAKGQAPYATIENFAKFCETYTDMMTHPLELQATVRACLRARAHVCVCVSCSRGGSVE